MYTFYQTYIYYIVGNYLNEWRDVDMGFRVRGRIKICKGLYINVGKKGITSVSAKVGGTTINKNRNGRVKATSKVCKGVSYETTLKQGKANKTNKVKTITKKQVKQPITQNIQQVQYSNIQYNNTKPKPKQLSKGATILIIFFVFIFIGIVEGIKEENNVLDEQVQQVEQVEQVKTQEEIIEEQNTKELNDMNKLFENCTYNLINIEQTTINNTRKHFNGTYMDLDGEQTHYIITLQYNKTKNDWVNTWIGNRTVNDKYWYDDYAMPTGDYAEMFESFNGLHSLAEVSGLYNKPSMEIIVVDINNEIIYRVLNGNWQDIVDSIESWASQDQLNIMVKGGINSRWCRDWKEFVMNK